ncbi:hypothetical protein QL285_073655 [Trifolium repens]|nr:hypothetical protein QL285_073655 [Trifolium repens]
MRPVVAKITPKKQNTIEEKQPTRKRSNQIYRDLQISTDLKTFRTQKESANLNRFEKRSENLESQTTNHATSTATSSPPTTTTTSPQHQQSTPKPDLSDTKSEHRHHHLNSSPPPKTSQQKKKKQITATPSPC